VQVASMISTTVGSTFGWPTTSRQVSRPLRHGGWRHLTLSGGRWHPPHTGLRR
jgi:hypothetical protein